MMMITVIQSKPCQKFGIIRINQVQSNNNPNILSLSKFIKQKHNKRRTTYLNCISFYYSLIREQKLLDDILQPTGISIRPSEHLLNEFYKRAKNLDRDKIFNGIVDKLMNYQSYITNQESVKILTKCLYLVDHLVQNKLEDIYEAFEERLDLFSNIKESYPTNKKINELCNSIITAFDETKIKSMNQQQKVIIPNNITNNNNVLLLDILPEQDNNTNLFHQNDQPINNTNNIFEDIFDIKANNNPNLNEIQNNNKELNELKKNQTKGFHFIKPKNQLIEEQRTKLSFIKPQSSSIQSDLDIIFNSGLPANNEATAINIVNSKNHFTDFN